MTKIALHFLFDRTGRGSSLEDSSMIHFRIFHCITLLCSVLFSSASLADRYDYQHGVSYIEPLKYSAEFKHVEYVNPNAPRGGTLLPSPPQTAAAPQTDERRRRPREPAVGCRLLDNTTGNTMLSTLLRGCLAMIRCLTWQGFVRKQDRCA